MRSGTLVQVGGVAMIMLGMMTDLYWDAATWEVKPHWLEDDHGYIFHLDGDSISATCSLKIDGQTHEETVSIPVSALEPFDLGLGAQVLGEWSETYLNEAMRQLFRKAGINVLFNTAMK